MGNNSGSLDKYPVAAVRHLIDARILKDKDRRDNAMCHYAFAAECALKVMYANAFPKSGQGFGHKVGEQWDDIAQYYAAFQTFDVKLEALLGKIAVPDKLFDRHPTRRYENDGTYSKEDLQDADSFAGIVVAEIIEEFIDGRFDL